MKKSQKLLLAAIVALVLSFGLQKGQKIEVAKVEPVIQSI